MMNIDIFVKSVLDALNKNNGQYVSPSEINSVLQEESLDYFNELRGAKSVNKAVYGKNRILDSRLNPFRAVAIVNFVNGVAQKPVGMKQIRSVSVTLNGKRIPVRQLEENRASNTIANPLADGIEEDPIFEEESATMTITPSFPQAVIKYIRAPKEAKWAYTLQGGRKPVYDPVNSIDIEWDDTEVKQLRMRVVNRLSLNTRDQLSLQVTSQEKQQS